MDGYVKSKKAAIRSVRRRILGKYSVTCLVLFLIPVWLFALVANQPPEKWTHADILFSHISQERIGLQRGRSYLLNTLDGRQFVIKSKFADVEEMSGYLVSGNTYHLVFSNTIAGGDHVEALWDEYVILQNLEVSMAQWEAEQQEAVIGIFVTLIMELIALIVIDRHWCKKEYAQIQKLKADIQRREAQFRRH